MPIDYKLPYGGGACPCEEQEKYYYAIINPADQGYIDMQNWSINGNDFILGCNTVLQSYGGSAIATNLAVWNGAPAYQYQYGYLAIKCKYSDLPNNIYIYDPAFLKYDFSWSPLYGGICTLGYPDYPNCVQYTYDKANPFVYYLEIYFYDQYMWNVNTGYGSTDGVPAYFIDFVSIYGSALDLNEPTTPNKIKTVIDGMFLNSCLVTVTPSGPNKLILKLSNVYCIRSGFYDPHDTKWKDAERNTVSCP